MELETDYKIAIIGLGYVGLPLATAFAEHYKVIGFDIDESRVSELHDYRDRTKEITTEKLKNHLENNLSITSDEKKLGKCNIYIITVPTPVKSDKTPDLNPLIQASKLVGKYLKQNDVVIYESTVYPGCTEEVCIPILKDSSNLKYNLDFFCGYSPERINPGDKTRPLESIKKVTSGSNEITSQFVDKLYKSIIIAGTHRASSIKVAEASKIIENTQRDLNISFMNEISLICEKLEIDTKEVIEAASTKWNFIKLFPGLVGGHCISVDPYYLVHKAETLGYIPEVIHSGRRINEEMPKFIGNKFIKTAIKKKIDLTNIQILILGFSFKENCNDFRNTKVISIYQYFNELNLNVKIYDPIVNKNSVELEYGIKLIDNESEIFNSSKPTGVILAVPHEEFLDNEFLNFFEKQQIFFDLKGVLDKNKSDFRL